MDPISFVIEKVKDGGFIVSPDYHFNGVRTPIYACTEIEDALEYIAKKLLGSANAEMKKLGRDELHRRGI